MRIRTAVRDDISVLAQMLHTGWHNAHGFIVDPDLARLRCPAEFMTRTATHLEQTP